MATREECGERLCLEAAETGAGSYCRADGWGGGGAGVEDRRWAWTVGVGAAEWEARDREGGKEGGDEGDGRRAEGDGDETNISAQRVHHVGARLNESCWPTLRNLVVLLTGWDAACPDAS